MTYEGYDKSKNNALIKEDKRMRNQQLCVDTQFEAIKDFRQLHRGQKVFLGYEFNLKNCKYLRAATVEHNWPSHWHSRFPNGYILLFVVNGEKTYKKYFDLTDETIKGKPRYIFAATKEVETIYFAKCAEKEKSVDASKVLIAEGNNNFALGNFWGAAKKYREATDLAPSKAEVYSRLGRTFLRLGLYQQALEPLNHALSLTCDPRLRGIIYDNIGMARSNIGDQSGAISSFGLALTSDPKNANLLVHRGISFKRIGQHERAYTDTLMALRLRPGYPPAVKLKAKLEASGHIAPLETIPCSPQSR